MSGVKDRERRAELNRRAVRKLVDAHARRTDERLLLAVRFNFKDDAIHLLEVLEGFPGEPQDAPLVTRYAPSAELLAVDEIELVLVSPEQFRNLAAGDSPTAAALKADGQVEFYTVEGKELSTDLPLDWALPAEEQREIAAFVGDHEVTPEAKAAVRKKWAS